MYISTRLLVNASLVNLAAFFSPGGLYSWNEMVHPAINDTFIPTGQFRRLQSYRVSIKTSLHMYMFKSDSSPI